MLRIRVPALFVASGTNADLVATLDGVSLTATGTVTFVGVTGDLASTLDAATLASTSAVTIAGTLIATLGAATLFSDGVVPNAAAFDDWITRFRRRRRR